MIYELFLKHVLQILIKLITSKRIGILCCEALKFVFTNFLYLPQTKSSLVDKLFCFLITLCSPKMECFIDGIWHVTSTQIRNRSEIFVVMIIFTNTRGENCSQPACLWLLTFRQGCLIFHILQWLIYRIIKESVIRAGWNFGRFSYPANTSYILCFINSGYILWFNYG